jgi:hypothetical protein
MKLKRYQEKYDNCVNIERDYNYTHRKDIKNKYENVNFSNSIICRSD